MTEIHANTFIGSREKDRGIIVVHEDSTLEHCTLSNIYLQYHSGKWVDCAICNTEPLYKDRIEPL
jgi:hypothetical protein